jgi:hypothetical protein
MKTKIKHGQLTANLKKDVYYIFKNSVNYAFAQCHVSGNVSVIDKDQHLSVEQIKDLLGIAVEIQDEFDKNNP